MITIEKITNDNVVVSNSGTGECLAFPPSTDIKILSNGNILLVNPNFSRRYELLTQKVKKTISAAGTVIYPIPPTTKVLFENLYTNFFFLSISGSGPITGAGYGYTLVSPFGDDATGERNNPLKPYRYPWTAAAAAVVGDLIFVTAGFFELGPGGDTDDGTKTLLSDGLNFEFSEYTYILHSQTIGTISELLSDYGTQVKARLNFNGATLEISRPASTTNFQQLLSNTLSDVEYNDLIFESTIGVRTSDCERLKMKFGGKITQGPPLFIDPSIPTSIKNLDLSIEGLTKTATDPAFEQLDLFELRNLENTRIKLRIKDTTYSNNLSTPNAVLHLNTFLNVDLDLDIENVNSISNTSIGRFFLFFNFRGTIKNRIRNVFHRGYFGALIAPEIFGEMRFINTSFLGAATGNRFIMQGRVNIFFDTILGSPISAVGSVPNVRLFGRLETPSALGMFLGSTGTTNHPSLGDITILAQNANYAFAGPSFPAPIQLRIIGDAISRSIVGFSDPTNYVELIKTGINDPNLV